MHNLKRAIYLGLFMVLADLIYSGNNMLELIIGGCWIIGAVVFYKQIFRVVCGTVKFVWTVMRKIWEYIMRL